MLQTLKLNERAALSRPPSDNIVKVLILTPEFPPHLEGGLGSHVSELVAGLCARGIAPSVLSYDPKGESEASDGLLYVRLFSGVEAGRRLRFEDVVALNKRLTDFVLNRLSDRCEFDLIHCHDWFGILAAVEIRAVLRIPLVTTVHMLQSPVAHLWGEKRHAGVLELETTCCRGSDHLITVSHAMSALIRDWLGPPVSKTTVIYNGMDVDVDSTRVVTTRDDEKPTIIYAGRIIPQKGLMPLFMSALLVLRRHPGVRYLIAGDIDATAYGSSIRMFVEHNALLKSRVSFLGKIPRQSLATLYRVAQCAVVPSVFEPFGYAAIEAMAAGVPVVASAVGGLTEIVDHERTGLLVPARAKANGCQEPDIELLAEAQLRLVNDPLLASQMSYAAQDRLMSAFTRDHMVSATIDVYQKAHPR